MPTHQWNSFTLKSASGTEGTGGMRVTRVQYPWSGHRTHVCSDKFITEQAGGQTAGFARVKTDGFVDQEDVLIVIGVEDKFGSQRFEVYGHRQVMLGQVFGGPIGQWDGAGESQVAHSSVV